MRRVAVTLTLAAATAVLGGCAYDPYSGTMVPCCGYYGYPYGYRYPPPYGPYGYPAPPASQSGQAQPGAQPGAYPDPAPQGTYPNQAQPGAYPAPTQLGPYPGPPQPGATNPGPTQLGAYQGQTQPGAYPGTAQPGAYPGPAGDPGSPPRGGSLTLRFAAANGTNDGHLTREQAAAAMPFVAQNFDAIDFDGKGYVTLEEIRAFLAERRAARGGRTGDFDTN